MSGLIGKKIGMTSIFDDNGKNIPCTVIEVGPCIVTQVRTKEVDGYAILQELLDLGFKLDTIVDHCIPIAATRLGEAWVQDTLSFSEATIGSANLQILLKHIAQDRENNFVSERGKRFLVCVHESEQHTLGALADPSLRFDIGLRTTFVLLCARSEISVSSRCTQ